ncbi:mechanosensitive ion channel-like protein [Loktanella sp. PT4BL]|uniref:mechanosensitive ion channel family protein n=1 Tax=Loktanella sp. PT4BL TaxID=2135611 RepID=UPI000D76DD85|nr:mechanosensitive ion channel domain-containing protein [Loktanella sp. PT4BL]PXW72140.1 mechanosensitive ion channel-like protein [Loktanella sp. PT4BL]
MEPNGLMEQAQNAFDQALVLAQGWLLSPAAWSQFALLIGAYLLARIASGIVTPRLRTLLTSDAANRSILSKARRFLLIFLPLTLPLLAYGFTAVGESVTRSLFGSGEVIAFGKRVFLFLAARALAKDIVTDAFLRVLARYILVPVAALYALGFLDEVTMALDAARVTLGNISFSALSIVRGVIVGSLLFWLGQWSNAQSSSYITQQPMRPAIRQLAIKTSEFAIFTVAFLILMNVMGINLSSLAIIGGAIGVGLGFGLQKIASNFISGVILMVEGQATVGDYVELDGGEAGTIIKMGARATILETFDGRWIVVPNEDFITTRVVNYSDSGSANRLEVAFSVSYDTDINRVPAIIEAAVSKHPGVLQDPEGPDCELRGFGDSGVDFGVEFWVEGIDDGKNKYASDVLFLIWNALKENDIEIPYPHRVVEFKGPMPA